MISPFAVKSICNKSDPPCLGISKAGGGQSLCRTRPLKGRTEFRSDASGRRRSADGTLWQQDRPGRRERASLDGFRRGGNSGEMRGADQGREVVMVGEQTTVIGKSAIRMGIRVALGRTGRNPDEGVGRRRESKRRTEEMKAKVPQKQPHDQEGKRLPGVARGADALKQSPNPGNGSSRNGFFPDLDADFCRKPLDRSCLRQP